ncbi:hypothetical protein ACFQZ4_27640 [Catellatospora coxensis]
MARAIMEQGVARNGAFRGRVVMLVDNGVKGDSRVQKQARSAADAGWEVVLLGVAPGLKTVTWKLGEADVRLVPMPRKFSQRANGWVRRKASGAKRRLRGTTPAATAPAAAPATSPAAAAPPPRRRSGGWTASARPARRSVAGSGAAGTTRPWSCTRTCSATAPGAGSTRSSGRSRSPSATSSTPCGPT